MIRIVEKQLVHVFANHTNDKIRVSEMTSFVYISALWPPSQSLTGDQVLYNECNVSSSSQLASSLPTCFMLVGQKIIIITALESVSEANA